MRPLCADWMEAGVLCALKRLCRQRVEVGHDSTAKWLVSGTLDEAAMSFNPPCRKRAAAGRVCHGAVLEAFAAERAAALYPIDRVELPPDAADQRLVCQLYFDAYAAAVWTSAHAEFIAALDEGLVEPQSPTIGTFPCASSAFDVSNLFIRRSMPKGEAYPKCSEALVQLLSRCTNPGSRGWDPVLKESLDNVGSRSIVQHAIVVCLTGMHPQIHPANRPSWKVRMRILRIADNRLSNLEHVVKAAMYIKEAVRRLLASTMVSVSAMHASLGNLGHPVRHFHQPPVQFPHIGMEAAMTAFVEAGTSMVTTTTAMGMTDTPNLPEALDRAFRARSEGFTPETGGVKWANSWLGTYLNSNLDPNHRLL